MNIFEKATRGKYRFNFKGLLTAEDLFDLKVAELDIIYKSLKAQVKLAEEESLFVIKTPQNEELDTKIAIVNFIFSLKIAEQEIRLQLKEKKERKQELMEILKDKQNSELQGKTKEEIEKMIAELE